MLLLAYFPLLLCVPILLVVGLVFVVVPGGFIIVLAGAYYLWIGFIGLLGSAAEQRRRATRARRPVGASWPFVRLAAPSPLRRPGTAAVTPRPVAYGNRITRVHAGDHARSLGGPPASLLPRRRSEPNATSRGPREPTGRSERYLGEGGP